MLKKIILGTLISSAVYAANQVELNVNNKEAEGQVRIDLARMGSTMEGTYVGARILNTDESNSGTISKIDPLMEVSFMVMRPVTSITGLSLGLGVKGEHTKFDGKDYTALPLGAEAEMKLPITTPFPFYVGGVLYYAPSVLTFQDGDEYFEARIHVDVEPIHNGRIEVGYRNIDTDLSSRNVTYNEALYFGLRYDF